MTHIKGAASTVFRLLTLWWVIAVVLAGVGGAAIGGALAGQQHAPQPTAAQANPAPAPTTITITKKATAQAPGTRTGTGASSSPRPKPTPTRPTLAGPPTASSTPTPTAPLVLAASAPLAITIPSIGVQSTLVQLGLNPDKSIEVPPLDDPDSKAGWYKYSPTPGQIGPTVILGHVDSVKYGPGVFFKLGALQPGATVEVTLTDRVVAVFTVDKVVAYPKSAFPSSAVYGAIHHPGLRLITCGGAFDPAAGSYESNIVAYATLTARRPAT
ncbi:class F sortase [Nakamurella sp. A5-74]|uniref:Class F sortase n=1 Tax=Nakamurella sp. A5-74 TaxID=3158264 RepID=A0AAU8DRK7_9ACTN